MLMALIRRKYMDISKSYDAKFVFLEHRSYIHGSSMTHGLFEAVRSWSLGLRVRLFFTYFQEFHGILRAKKRVAFYE
jgi:hypothetical protein